MELDWLEVARFRCYESLRFEPEAGVNVLVGDNGAGKTSALEAIAYLGFLRSFRGTPDEALISIGADDAIVRGEFTAPSGTVRIESELTRQGRRRVLVNGKRPQRYRDVLAQVPVVVFQPDDLDLVKRGPGMRRAYLDDLGAQLWPQAGADQQEFERALRQRNALLRTEGRSADPDTVAAWDAEVADLGARVFGHRVRLLDAIEPHLEEGYRVVGADGMLGWEYVTNWGGAVGAPGEQSREHLAATLTSRRERDFDQRTTTGGPHRDDPVLIVNGRPARAMASQGEQRTVALALRVAAFRMLAEQHDTLPILLLDDVFSELDPVRSEGVLSLLGDGQVFVTTARDDDLGVEGRRWMVKEGTIRAG